MVDCFDTFASDFGVAVRGEAVEYGHGKECLGDGSFSKTVEYGYGKECLEYERFRERLTQAFCNSFVGLCVDGYRRSRWLVYWRILDVPVRTVSQL